jgi:hypothetical protein
MKEQEINLNNNINIKRWGYKKKTKEKQTPAKDGKP